jgi:OOP family OmpA-OmpF porin
MGTPMLKYLKTPVIVAVMGLGLSACANMYNTAKTTAPAGDSYAKALFKNYMMLADSERREEDWTDANFFASKALATTRGMPLGPQELAERSLTEKNLAELTPARAALVAALDGGASVRKPEAAAEAVAGFDCWMQEAEENIQPDDIAACKKMFVHGMANLKEEPKPKMVAKGPWTIYFDFDSKRIESSEDAVLTKAAATAEEMGNGAIIVTGHADTSGPANYNLKLSADRAKAVVEALGQLGIASNRISANATGEKDLAVPTADGVREPKNRRVEIRVAQ